MENKIITMLCKPLDCKSTIPGQVVSESGQCIVNEGVLEEKQANKQKTGSEEL